MPSPGRGSNRRCVIIARLVHLAALAAVQTRTALGAVQQDVSRAAIWTARPIMVNKEGGGDRCADICRGDRQGGGELAGWTSVGSAPVRQQCGVEMEFSGVQDDARIIGLELDVDLVAGDNHAELRVSAPEALALQYEVYERNPAEFASVATTTNEAKRPPHTVTVRIAHTETASVGGSLILRLEACRLRPEHIMGRGASVFVAVAQEGADVSWGYGQEGEERGRGFQELRGILPTVPTLEAGGGYGFEGEQWWPEDEGEERGGGNLFALLKEMQPLVEEGGGVPGNARVGDDIGFPGTGNAVRENGGPAALQPALMVGRRRLAEDCSASCLRSSAQRCFNDPDCEDGGLGCNALNDPLCRFCGFDGFVECDFGPSESAEPTPAPTSSPDREVCTASCLTSRYFTCFDDSTCRVGGLGCNARGDFFCRFCGFDEFVECPSGVGFTPAPTTVATTPPTLVPTMAPTTIAPTTSPTISPTFAPSPGPTTMVPLTMSPTVGPTGAPTRAPTAAPTAAPTRAPTAAPTRAPTRAPTAAPTVRVTNSPTIAPTQAVGPLGPSYVTGSISAFGVPDDLLKELGKTTIVQNAVCALNPCPDGPESVLVGEDAADIRKLLLSSSEEERGALPRRPSVPRLRRRLADFEDVVFRIPSDGGSGESVDVQTGSQHAASFFNKLKDPDALAAAADAMGVEVKDLDFGVLVYTEGTGADIENDFLDVGPAGKDDDASAAATVVVAVILIAAMILLACCVFFVFKSRHKKQRDEVYTTPPQRHKTRLSTIEEEQGMQLGKNEALASYNVAPDEHGILIRTSSHEGNDTAQLSSKPFKTLPHTQSMGSEASSIVSEKFAYANPMHRDSPEKRGSSPNEYGDDLAQHYEGDDDGRSDVSSDLPNKTRNPLFSETSLRSSPTSTADASASREASSRSPWRSGEVDHSLSSISDDYTDSSSASTADGGAGSSNVMRMSMLSGTSTQSSSRLGMTPYGLSPVAETGVGGRGEADVSTSSSSVRSSSVGSHRLSSSGGGGGGFGMYTGGAFNPNDDAFDDDSESVFRPSSPGSVSRPLQPLMAVESPLSCGTGSQATSRSNSFASPKPPAGVPAQGADSSMHNITLWVPGVGLQGGISSENLKAIKGAGSSDAEREAVREAVRSQRRKISRSASHETPRIANQLSPTPENPMEEGIAAGSGDYNSSGKGSSKDHGRSRSMSPGRARIPGHLQQQQLQQQQLQQSVSGYGSPRMEPLTSGSSASMSIDHSSSTESAGNTLVGQEGPSSPIQGRFSSENSFNSGNSGASADAAGGSRSTASASASASASATASGESSDLGVESRRSRLKGAATTPTMTPGAPGIDRGRKEKRLVEEEHDVSAGGRAAGVTQGARSTSAREAHGGGAGKANKGLKFSSRGRAQGRAQRQAAAAAAQPKPSSSTPVGSPPPPPYDASAGSDGADRVEGGASAQAGQAAAGVCGPGRPLSIECQKKALAVGRAAAAGGAASEGKRMEDERQVPALVVDEEDDGSDERMPASALKSSGSFRSSGEQRSVSFANASGESSDVDGVDEAVRVAKGAGAQNTASTLRQHLADPSQPSGSYRQQESDESSTFSEESLSPSYKGGSSRASSFSSRSSYSTASSYSNASYGAASYGASSYGARSGGGGGGGPGDMGLGRGMSVDSESTQQSHSFRRASSESSQESVSEDGRHVQQRQRQDERSNNAEQESQVSWESTSIAASASGAAAAAAAAGAGAGAGPPEVGEALMREPASVYQNLFAGGTERPESGELSRSPSGESKRRMRMR